MLPFLVLTFINLYKTATYQKDTKFTLANHPEGNTIGCGINLQKHNMCLMTTHLSLFSKMHLLLVN